MTRSWLIYAANAATPHTLRSSWHITIAGILALGVYPQQYFPSLSIQAHVAPSETDIGTRAIDAQRITGPIPLMLEQAIAWVRRNTRTRIQSSSNGHLRDEPEFPSDAIRELISNALVHRDLGPHALSETIGLRLEREQLVLTNFGGLWGVDVSQLGKIGVTSARNAWLVDICKHVHTGADRRVVEVLASGIPTVLDSLANAGLPAPHFHDQGIRFTVRLPRINPRDHRNSIRAGASETGARLKSQGQRNAEALLTILREAPNTMKNLAAKSGLSIEQTRYALGLLRKRGEIELIGGRGELTQYRVANDR